MAEHDVFALGHDYGQDYDLSSAGKLADEYRLFNDTLTGKSKQIVDIYKTYQADAIAQKIVEKPVFDALANWRDISNQTLNDLDKEFDLVEAFKSALEAARLRRYSFIYPVLRYSDTKRPVGNKIPLERVIAGNREVEISNVVVLGTKDIPCDLQPSGDIDSDIYSDNFGKPTMYKVNQEEIHHSRLVVIDSNNFFSSISGYLADFHSMGKQVHMTSRRNNAFVLKADFAEVQKFIQAKKKVGITGGSDTELERIAEVKAKTLAINLRDHNVAVIGQSEQLENFQSNNIDDLVRAYEQQQYVLAGAASFDVSNLFSIVEGGIGNSGFKATEIYSQSLDTLRSKNVDKALRKMDTILSLVYNFDYDRDSWTWNDTKAEEMLVRLRGVETETIERQPET